MPCEKWIQGPAVNHNPLLDEETRVSSNEIEQKLPVMSGASCGYAPAVRRGGIAVLGQLSTRAFLWPLNKRAQHLHGFTQRNKCHLM